MLSILRAWYKLFWSIKCFDTYSIINHLIFYSFYLKKFKIKYSKSYIKSFFLNLCILNLCCFALAETTTSPVGSTTFLSSFFDSCPSLTRVRDLHNICKYSLPSIIRQYFRELVKCCKSHFVWIVYLIYYTLFKFNKIYIETNF